MDAEQPAPPKDGNGEPSLVELVSQLEEQCGKLNGEILTLLVGDGEARAGGMSGTRRKQAKDDLHGRSIKVLRVVEHLKLKVKAHASELAVCYQVIGDLNDGLVEYEKCIADLKAKLAEKDK